MREPVETTEKDVFSKRFELKFTINSSVATEIREWSKAHMSPDEHLEPSKGSYRITSLYLDTPQLGVYHREEMIKGRKFRLRRYGESTLIWLELKRKRGDLVRKRRSHLPESQLASFVQKESALEPATNSPTEWFQERIDRYKLQPSTWVEYERFAYVGRDDFPDARLTIDKNIRCLTAKEWQVPGGLGSLAQPLSSSEQLELKFCDVMPNVFKKLLIEFSLTRSVLSKYRTSVSICYLVMPNAIPEAPIREGNQ